MPQAQTATTRRRAQAEAVQPKTPTLEKLIGGSYVPPAGRQVITPEIARVLMHNNTHNRPISRAAVNRLIATLKAGEWKYNGEAIKFAKDGALLDGQHRLLAIAESEVAAEVLVVTDLPNDAFATLDQGRKRSGGDVLFTRGLPYHQHVSVACGMLYRLMKNKPIYGGNAPIPAYGIENIFVRHPGLVNAVEFCAPIAKRGDNAVIGLGYLAAYLYLGDKIMGDQARAVKFAEGMATGVELADNSPVLQFRHKILGGRAGRVMQAQAKMALFAKSFGLFMTDQTVKSLTHPSATAAYWDLIPTLGPAVEKLTPEKALRDLTY